MLFLNQKIFLDVKDYSRIDRLEEDIRQFGGIIEKFLSKEITCVVTNRTRNANLLLHKDVTTSTSTLSQSLRPVCGSRVMSRGQSLLMRSNSFRDTSVCDPVAFAQMWGIKIVTLDAVVQAIDRQVPTCNPSSQVTKQAIKSHCGLKRRKILGTSVKVEDTVSNFRPFTTKFSGAFVKFEDTESNFQPFFNQYSTFPHLALEGDLSNGIFQSAEYIRPVAVRKNVITTASTRKRKVWSKRGYCECCDVMYDDLNEHLISADHQRFAEHVENFASLDKLIHQISLRDCSAVLLPAKDNCTYHVACETTFTECAEEMKLRNLNNLSAEAVESVSCHNVHLQQNQSRDCQSKPEESDKVVNALENCKENHRVSEEQTDKNSRSPVFVSVNDTGTHSVNSKDHLADNGVETISDCLHSQTLPVHCDDDNILSTFGEVSQLVDTCEKTEGLCKEKSCNASFDENLSHMDDMPEFISSDCVVNLLELLSSEDSVNSVLHAREGRYPTVKVCENHTSIPPMNSVALPCMCAVCSDDTAHAELLANEKEHCQQTTTDIINECCFPLTSMQNDSLDRFGTSVMMERHSASFNKYTTESEQVSKSVTLPAVDLSNLQTLSLADAVKLSETSLIKNNVRNDSDTGSCKMKVDGDASVMSPCEIQNDCTFLSPVPISVDPPATCAIAITPASPVPVHACCQVNSVGTFVDGPLSPVYSSGLIADSLDLHETLLTMAYGLETAEHHKPLMQASYPADQVDFLTSSNNHVWLPMTFSPTLCFSECSAPLADDGDAGLCTPVHSRSDSFENLATSAADSNISTELASLCENAPLSGIVSLVNDSLQSSVPCVRLQSNTEMNSVSDREVDACHVQEKGGDLHINSDPRKTFEAEIKSDVMAKCTSVHGSEDYRKSTSADTAQLETRLVTFDNASGSPVSAYSALSLRPKVTSMSSVLASESHDTTEQAQEADADADSASTIVYSCDCTASSLQEHLDDRHSPDENKSETAVNYAEPSVSSANSAWKVISFVDCRMRLVRAEAVFPALSIQNKNKVSNKSSVLGPDSHDAAEPVVKTDVDDDSIPAVVQRGECPGSSLLEHANDRIYTKSETVGGYREPSASNTDSTWEVISFVDCHMRLVRSKAVCPAPSAHTVSSDRRPWYPKNLCNLELKVALSKTPGNVLSC